MIVSLVGFRTLLSTRLFLLGRQSTPGGSLNRAPTSEDPPWLRVHRVLSVSFRRANVRSWCDKKNYKEADFSSIQRTF